MENVFGKIAESKIREALEKGELKNLPGEGKPLNLEPLNPFEAPEDRMANKILRNFGIAPQEVELQKEIENLKIKIKESSNGEEIAFLKKKLQEISIRHSVIMEKRRSR